MSRFDILLFDDGTDALRRLEATLRKALPESEVHGASSVSTASRVLADGDFGAALIPVVLGGVDGIELGRELHLDPAAATVPLVLLTDPASSAETLDAALRVGFRAFLPTEPHPAEVTALTRSLGGGRGSGTPTGSEAEQRYVAVGRLAGGVAHDFNNALTGIMGYAVLAQEEIDREDPVYSMLEQIIRGADRAASLARHLLTFARKQALHPRSVDVNSVLGDMDRVLRRVLRENVELEVRREPELGRTDLDPTALEQILVHLVIDAGDALPQGGKVLLATGVTEEEESRIRLTIDGHLPTPTAHDDDPTLAVARRGLGQQIAREIADRCGWTLRTTSGERSVRSEVLFPRLAEPMPVPRAAPPPLRTTGGGETILLVDDEEMVLRMTAEVLTAAGYQVLSAAGSEEALRICQAHPGSIDLVLTDVVMPVMNGPRMVRHAREFRSGLRALYMSGYAADALAMEGGLEDDAVLMEKPFLPSRLTDVIRRMLSGRL